MCGRRVEGWRGLVPAGPVDLGEPHHGGQAGQSGAGHSPVTPGPDDAAAAPQDIAAGQEPTRPIRISATLAAASASVDDEESRRPTGEVPSIGHEVRAKAPDQRVHTSPTGNILPSEVLQTLDAAIAANRRAAPPARPTGSAAETSSSFRRPAERSGDLPLPRTQIAPPALAELSPRGGEPAAAPRRAAAAPAPPRSDRSSPAPNPRRPERGPQPSPAPHPGRARAASRTADRDLSADAANAPVAVGFEPTHYIPRRQRGALLMRVLRTCMWAVLWLGLGGVVAFGAFVFYRRSHPLKPPVPAAPAPAATARRTAAPAKGTAGTPKPPAPAQVNSTRARDLVVPIPASPGRPAAPGVSPTAPVAAAPPPPAAPAAAAAPPAEPPLDPQEQAAADQNVSNIEFVVAERLAQVRACYDRAVRSAGPDAPAGRIEMSLTLSDEGQPIRISTVSNTVGVPQLAVCMEQRIAEWRFPRPLGAARTFPVRLAFSPSPQQSGPRPRR